MVWDSSLSSRPSLMRIREYIQHIQLHSFFHVSSNQSWFVHRWCPFPTFSGKKLLVFRVAYSPSTTNSCKCISPPFFTTQPWATKPSTQPTPNHRPKTTRLSATFTRVSESSKPKSRSKFKGSNAWGEAIPSQKLWTNVECSLLQIREHFNFERIRNSKHHFSEKKWWVFEGVDMLGEISSSNHWCEQGSLDMVFCCGEVMVVMPTSWGPIHFSRWILQVLFLGRDLAYSKQHMYQKGAESL